MRYEALTNMKSKVDKQAADVLLYTQRCAKAIKEIPAPTGIAVFITTRAVTGAQPGKAVLRAKEILDEISGKLDQANASADRASRKKNRAKKR